MILTSPQDLKPYQKRGSRLLGLDVGSKTVGLALSDTRWIIASPLLTLRRHKFTLDVQELLKIVQEFLVGGLVIGLPINMNGEEGARCQSIRQFARNLEPYNFPPLCFWDERLSTLAVTRTMIAADLSRKRQAEVVDKMAASYILQGALDYLSHSKDPEKSH